METKTSRADRREFLKLTLAGTATLGIASTGAQLAGCSSQPERAADGRVFLRDADVQLFTAIVPVVLAGVLPDDEAEREALIAKVVNAIDAGALALSAPIRKTLWQLFDLLNWRFTRYATTGIWAPWNEATAEDIDAFLNRWRSSSVSLFNAGYRVLTQLVQIRYFTMPVSWADSGYPGPQEWAIKALR